MISVLKTVVKLFSIQGKNILKITDDKCFKNSSNTKLLHKLLDRKSDGKKIYKNRKCMGDMIFELETYSIPKKKIRLNK